MECQGYYIAEPEMLEWSCYKSLFEFDRNKFIYEVSLKIFKSYNHFYVASKPKYSQLYGPPE